ADALALPARELVRVAIGEVRVEADQTQQLLHPDVPVSGAADAKVVQRLLEDVPDRHARVEGGERVLEDHLHLPPDPAQASSAQLGDILAVEGDGPGRHRQERRDQTSERGFPAAGLTDKAERLTAPDLE